jgi:hypothetical protein
MSFLRFLKMVAPHVDNLLVAMGNPGRFQVLTFLLLSGNNIVNVWNNIAPIFYVAKTRHHCKVDNISLVPIVTRNNERQLDDCMVFSALNHGRTGRKKLGGRKQICPTFRILPDK